MSNSANSNIDQEGILKVVVDSPLRAALDYLPQSGLAASDYPVGCRCEVPFGKRRKVIGLVVNIATTSEFEPDALKRAGAPLESAALLGERDLNLIRWVSDYYQYPLGATLFTLLPRFFCKSLQTEPYSSTAWHISVRGKGLSENALARAHKQQALLGYLRASNDWIDIDEIKQQGFTSQHVRALAEKGLIESSKISRMPATCKSVQQGSGIERHKSLNSEQKKALEICIPTTERKFQVTLLEGITGSGKTEVYLQAAAKVLAQGEQVLILVPEISLTPQTMLRFVQRFECKIALLHSGLNDRERAAAWLAVRSGEAGILLGTRSAIATPLQKPGLIIVDEEHDQSYKQHDSLRYSARDLAVRRAQQLGIPIILGTATPSLESKLNVQRGRYHVATLTQRHAGASTAAVEFIDTRRVSLHAGISEAALSAIQATVARERQTLVFINRRGYAPQLLCHDCGWSEACQHCDTLMTYHKSKRELCCHHCDFRKPAPRQCPRCNSRQLKFVGEGTERCEEALQQLFRGVDIIRVDRDTVRSLEQLNETLTRIANSPRAILIGTQMLAKGHHFSNLETVVMLNIDHGLYSADFRSIERTLQLLTQVTGRAGRESQSGRVLIQTHLPDHPVLTSWQTQGYSESANLLLEERQLRSLPPFGFLAHITADSPSPEVANQFLRHVSQILTANGSANNHAHDNESKNLTIPTQPQVIGPIAAIMERRAGRHRAVLLIRSTNRANLHELLRGNLIKIDAIRKTSGLRWQIDIDPQTMP